MASKFLRIPSAISGNTVYSDGKLCARNVGVTLPEVNYVMAEVLANGTMDVPISGWLEAMELAISLKGISDENCGWLGRQQTQSIEIRAVEDALNVDSSKVEVPIKAFFRAIPGKLPSMEMEPGEVPENELTFAVVRYQLFVNNQEQWCIDRMNNIFRVCNKDYATSVEQYL